MVHWIYALECEDGYVYIGETTRLYRRFNEHLNRRGGMNTNEHKPCKLIGLYKVNDNHSFMRYRDALKLQEYNKFIIESWGEDEGDNLLVENHITERFLYERRDQGYNVRGGKYTKDKFFYWRNPIEIIPVEDILDRPLCNCGYPSEVKISKDKLKIYFVCSLKNVWDDFFSGLEIDNPCDFWKLYTEDNNIKQQYEVSKQKAWENWVVRVPEKIRYTDPCISCNKTDYIAIFNRGQRRLCQLCILTKYDSIKEKFHIKHLFDD